MLTASLKISPVITLCDLLFKIALVIRLPDAGDGADLVALKADDGEDD